MKNNMIKIGIIIAIVVIGIAVLYFSHFQFSLYYSKNVRMEIYLGKNFILSDVKSCVKEVLPEQEFIIEKAGVFSDTINITTTELTDNQKEQIVNNLNEFYETKLTVDGDTYVIYNSNIRGRDIFSNYISISAISAIIIILTIVFMYGKGIGYRKVTLISLFITIVGQFVYYVILSILHIDINRIIPGTSVAIFIASMIYLMLQFEKINETK